VDKILEHRRDHELPVRVSTYYFRPLNISLMHAFWYCRDILLFETSKTFSKSDFRFMHQKGAESLELSCENPNERKRQSFNSF